MDQGICCTLSRGHICTLHCTHSLNTKPSCCTAACPQTAGNSAVHSRSPCTRRTAALVIVGDEILAAKVEDLNTHFLCSELRAIGWRVCKACCPLLCCECCICLDLTMIGKVSECYALLQCVLHASPLCILLSCHAEPDLRSPRLHLKLPLLAHSVV